MNQTQLIIRRHFSDVQKQANVALQNAERMIRYRKSSPYPKTFTDSLLSGKEVYLPKNVSELAALSGMPKAQAKREVVISQRPLKTLLTGSKYSHQWTITWKVEQDSKWPNSLNGWTSTNDPMTSVVLNFATKEDAKAFAERNGWKYQVKGTQSLEGCLPADTHDYSHNFLDKRTSLLLAEEGLKCKIWENSTYGDSHWFMPLNYHGTGEVRQHGHQGGGSTKQK